MQVGHDEIRDGDGANPVSHSTLFSGTAKAWSCLNGAGFAERDSFNISGHVDNAVCDYSYAISSDMADTNYAWAAGCSGDTTNQNWIVCGLINTARSTIKTAGAARLAYYTSNGVKGGLDVDDAMLTIHGDLA